MRAEQRFAQGRRCPICGGADRDPRGSERRCYGFLSQDGAYAHCSREQHAGSLKVREGSSTYGHRLRGPCGCGTTHKEVAFGDSNIEATYDYRDEKGDLLYQVVRYVGKTFKQRRPDGADRWIWKIGGVRRVLYRLVDLLEADTAQLVFVVEGEKDADGLRDRGLLATTNAQGAGKWHTVADCAASSLRGRNIVVIADADGPGRKHAADVARHLGGVATRVRMLELPGAKDASQWIANGGTTEQLLNLVEQVPTTEQPGASAPPNIEEQFALEVSGKRQGLPCCTQGNIAIALRKLGIVLRYDEFGERECIEGLPGFGPHVEDAAVVRIMMLVDSKFQFRPGKDFFYDVLSDRARMNTYHPVRDYLSALVWDRNARVDTWLSRYAGADDTEYTRAVGRLVLAAAVRRVRQPGCKFDEMIVLESKQGTNKSSALRVLAVNDEWFADDLPLDADTKRQMESTAGKWIVEAGELKGMSKSVVTDLKAYLSRQVDQARMAYARKEKKSPRQCVIIGTTNETADYLRDSTGNRRFWPVAISMFDIESLRADRDQLWAEAAHIEASGESIRLDPKFYGDASEQQDSRTQTDPIEVLLEPAFGHITGKIHTADAWRILPGTDKRTPTQDEMTRFGSAMRRLGWEKEQLRDGADDKGKPRRPNCYVRGAEIERERWLTVVGTDAGARVVPR